MTNKLFRTNCPQCGNRIKGSGGKSTSGHFKCKKCGWEGYA